MKIEVCACVMAWIWNKVVGDAIRVKGVKQRRVFVAKRRRWEKWMGLDRTCRDC
jgi:hypothetical protein